MARLGLKNPLASVVAFRQATRVIDLYLPLSVNRIAWSGKAPEHPKEEGT